jgi:hypothetical protein
VEDNNFTVQTDGQRTGVLNALARAATAVTEQDYPYVWGGGHAEAGVASVGDIGGPGANGKQIGYDCSGAVAAVLAAAGLWPAGGAVPNDAGVIAELLLRGEIAPGPGTAPDEVTLYDHPGVHIFMNIAGRFFGTSDGGQGPNPKGGAGWIDDNASDVANPAFKEYHIVPSVLQNQTVYGHDFTFQLSPASSLADDFLIGDDVRVGYVARAGTMDAVALGWVGQMQATATVTGFTPDGTGIIVRTQTGQTMTVDGSDVEDVLASVEPGDTVNFVYLRSGTSLVARTLSVVAVPVQLTATGTITTIAPDLSSFTITTAAGRVIHLSTAGNAPMLTGLAKGASVQVTYTQAPVGPLTATEVSPIESSALGTGTGTPGTTTAAPGTTTAAPGTTTTPAPTTPTAPAATTPAAPASTASARSGGTASGGTSASRHRSHARRPPVT